MPSFARCPWSDSVWRCDFDSSHLFGPLNSGEGLSVGLDLENFRWSLVSSLISNHPCTVQVAVARCNFKRAELWILYGLWQSGFTERHRGCHESARAVFYAYEVFNLNSESAGSTFRLSLVTVLQRLAFGRAYPACGPEVRLTATFGREANAAAQATRYLRSGSRYFPAQRLFDAPPNDNLPRPFARKWPTTRRPQQRFSGVRPRTELAGGEECYV